MAHFSSLDRDATNNFTADEDYVEDLLLDLNLGGPHDHDTDSTSSDVSESFTESIHCDDDSQDRHDPDQDNLPVPDIFPAGNILPGKTPSPHEQHSDDIIDWQSIIEDTIKPKWPNGNWTTISRLLNVIGSTDRDADVILDSIRTLDWTQSIPSSVAELRRFENEALGTNKFVNLINMLSYEICNVILIV